MYFIYETIQITPILSTTTKKYVSKETFLAHQAKAKETK